jgi:hypothetical protein
MQQQYLSAALSIRQTGEVREAAKNYKYKLKASTDQTFCLPLAVVELDKTPTHTLFPFSLPPRNGWNNRRRRRSIDCCLGGLDGLEVHDLKGERKSRPDVVI